MLLGRKKETRVKELMVEHLEKVEECLGSMHKTMEIYLEGKVEEAKTLSYKTHVIESEADQKRRDIIHLLYGGAFLPIHREGLIRFVDLQDKIADKAESCCDFALCQRPEVPSQFRKTILELTGHSIATFSPMKEAVAHLFEDFSILRAKVADINRLESEVDVYEWEITHQIFMSKLPLAQKMHLGELIWHLAETSDIIEDAADCLESLIIQKRV